MAAEEMEGVRAAHCSESAASASGGGKLGTLPRPSMERSEGRAPRGR